MLNVQLQQDITRYANDIRKQCNITQYPVYMETLIPRYFETQVQIIPSPEVQPGRVHRTTTKEHVWILHTNAGTQTFEQQRILNYKLAQQMAQYLLQRYMQHKHIHIEAHKQAEDILLRHILLPEQAEKLTGLFPLPMLCTLFCLPARVLKPMLTQAV